MLTIRLSRVGTTKRPFYRVVVVESSAPRDGRFVEILGHYNPRAEPEVLEVDRARVSHWIGNGASPSDTVRTLLARHPVPDPADASVEAAEAPAVVETATPAESADETQAVT